jgi:hypothetical protein
MLLRTVARALGSHTNTHFPSKGKPMTILLSIAQTQKYSAQCLSKAADRHALGQLERIILLLLKA